MDTQNLVVGAIGDDFYATLERVGQRRRSLGDEVVVVANVFLRALAWTDEDGDSRSELVEEVCYGHRALVCGEATHRSWGSYFEAGDDSPCGAYAYRCHEKNFMAPTWAEAEALAADYIRTELGYLVAALDARAAALLAAGE